MTNEAKVWFITGAGSGIGAGAANAAIRAGHRAVLPAMRRQRAGHLINISSVAGVVGQGNCAAYGATKFAVEGLSLSVAQEVERFGIKVTLVEPGFFRTGLRRCRGRLGTIQRASAE